MTYADLPGSIRRVICDKHNYEKRAAHDTKCKDQHSLTLVKMITSQFLWWLSSERVIVSVLQLSESCLRIRRIKGPKEIFQHGGRHAVYSRSRRTATASGELFAEGNRIPFIVERCPDTDTKSSVVIFSY